MKKRSEDRKLNKKIHQDWIISFLVAVFFFALPMICGTLVGKNMAYLEEGEKENYEKIAETMWQEIQGIKDNPEISGVEVKLLPKDIVITYTFSESGVEYTCKAEKREEAYMVIGAILFLIIWIGLWSIIIFVFKKAKELLSKKKKETD